MNYCPRCARPLAPREIDGRHRPACEPVCGFVHWDNPVPVVAALIEYRGGVLLARNAAWAPGVFSMISGFLERDESPEAAVLRELGEELGLRGRVRRLIGCYALPARNQIILAYAVEAEGDVVPYEEIAEVLQVSRETALQRDYGAFALTAEVVRDWGAEVAAA